MTDNRLNLCSNEKEVRFVNKLANMEDVDLLILEEKVRDHPLAIKRAINFIHLELMDRGYKKVVVETWEKR